MTKRRKLHQKTSVSIFLTDHLRECQYLAYSCWFFLSKHKAVDHFMCVCRDQAQEWQSSFKG